MKSKLIHTVMAAGLSYGLILGSPSAGQENQKKQENVTHTHTFEFGNNLKDFLSNLEHRPVMKELFLELSQKPESKEFLKTVIESIEKLFPLYKEIIKTAAPYRRQELNDAKKLHLEAELKKKQLENDYRLKLMQQNSARDTKKKQMQLDHEYAWKKSGLGIFTNLFGKAVWPAAIVGLYTAKRYFDLKNLASGNNTENVNLNNGNDE